MWENIVEVVKGNFYLLFSVRTLFIIFVFFIVKLLIKAYINNFADRLIKNNDTYETKKNKKTRLAFVRRFAFTVLFILEFLLILTGLPQFRSFSYSLLASAGIIAVIVGFATQKTLSNLISGIFLAMYEPFRVGDKIRIMDMYGEVEDITLRHTVVRTWNNRRIVVPNSRIDDEEIFNFSLVDEKVLWTIDMPISYDADIDKAREIMTDHAVKHPSNIQFTIADDAAKKNFEPYVKVTECKEYYMNLRLYFWSDDAWRAWGMGFDLTESIKKAFDKKGIEIPYPYRTLVYKKDLMKKKPGKKR